MATRTFGWWIAFLVPFGVGALTVPPDTPLGPWAWPVFWGCATLLAIVVVVWFYSHRRRIWRMVGMIEPIHVIVLGLVIALGGAIWFFSRPPASARSDLVPRIECLEKAIALVEPRKLTAEQVAVIEEFLLARPKQKIHVVCERNNMEANAYAAQLYEAFSRGHWEAETLRTANDKESIQGTLTEGLRFKVIYPRDSKGNMHIQDDLRRVFELAKIPVGSSGASRNGETEQIQVMLYVGHKPRTHVT